MWTGMTDPAGTAGGPVTDDTPAYNNVTLRFSGPSAGYPQSPAAITLAAAEAGLLTAQQEVFANPAPLVPVTNEPVPRQ